MVARKLPLAGLPLSPEAELLDDACLDFVTAEIELMRRDIRSELSTLEPMLAKASGHYFECSGIGKKTRPMLLLLISAAMALAATKSPAEAATAPWKDMHFFISDRQRKLGQIVEMLHTASLIHDDVIDEAPMRRGILSVHKMFNNKIAILSADYVFSRVSVVLASLRHLDVIRIMSGTIAELVEGEIMQFRLAQAFDTSIEAYLEKSYKKTASLLSNGARCAALLAEYPKEMVESASAYGKHLGIAFQLTDDLLDFIGDEARLGKPIMMDARVGIFTAPFIFALNEDPCLVELFQKEDMNLEDIRGLILRTNGIGKTKDLAKTHSRMAAEAIATWPDSRPKRALLAIASRLVNRTT